MNVKTKLTARACPQCQGMSIRRSHRIGFVERCLMRLSMIRPYRCLNCDSRFYLYDGSFRPLFLRRSVHANDQAYPRNPVATNAK